MRPVLLAIALAVASCLTLSAASAGVHARISKSGQTMDVFVRGVHYYSWPVSTGRGRYATPSGTFRPQRLERRWYSTKYNNAPMHYAVFYSGGYASMPPPRSATSGAPPRTAACAWRRRTPASSSRWSARTGPPAPASRSRASRSGGPLMPNFHASPSRCQHVLTFFIPRFPDALELCDAA